MAASSLFEFTLGVSQKKGNKRSKKADTKKRQREMAERGRKLDEIGNWDVTFGINNNLKYYKGRKKPVRVAKAFLWGEFGTRNQPARPAVRDLWKRKRNRYASQLQTMVAVYLLPRYKSGQWPKRLKNYGKRIIFDIRNALQAYKKIGNAAATIVKKGFNNPLIDTRKMQQAWEARVYRRGNKKAALRNFRDLGKAMRDLQDATNDAGRRNGRRR